MTQTASAPGTASCGLSAQHAPRRSSSSALLFVRLNTVRACPAASRCPAMAPPMTSVKIQAIFMIVPIDFSPSEQSIEITDHPRHADKTKIESISYLACIPDRICFPTNHSMEARNEKRRSRLLYGDDGGVRQAWVNRFPYSLLYGQDGEAIVIVAIAHLHREPHYWIDRTIAS